MTTGYLTHPSCLRHEMGPSHPEAPRRLLAIETALARQGLDRRLRRCAPPAATRAQLLRVHTPGYLDELFARAPGEGLVWLDPDTAMNPYSLEAALHAAGAAVHAVDEVLAGRLDSAFCAVRPPGHHAGPARAMGFCLFNNVAIAAAHALEAHGLERVAIVDFDVHHGNGTEEIFREELRVRLVSSFQHPFYPFGGAGGGNPNLVPLPLPAGTAGGAFRAAWEALGLPALEAFAPQLVLFSAGFDGHRLDPLAGWALEADDYAWLTTAVARIAAVHGMGRMVSCLEGGYHPEALAQGVTVHLLALVGGAARIPGEPGPGDAGP